MTPDAHRPAVTIETGPLPGAIAVLMIHRDASRALPALADRDWARQPIGHVWHGDLAGIDDGLVVRLPDDRAIVTPHGGPAVVRTLAARLEAAVAAEDDRGGRGAGRVASDAGAGHEVAGRGDRGPHDGEPANAERFPETRDPLTAVVLELLGQDVAPRAIDLLLAQPARWHAAVAAGRAWTSSDAARSRRLDRLLDPPSVVLVGAPDIGKSTLANALAGRTVAVTSPGPGTTRDAPRVRLDLDGVAVLWHDAPGLRATDDPVERAAIERVGDLVAGADVLIAAADARTAWPALDRLADLRIGLRADAGARSDADLVVSARDGTGLDALVAAVVERLVPAADRDDPAPWDAAGRLRGVADPGGA